jgi:tetratricopeptide (TPR) repeat protein
VGHERHWSASEIALFASGDLAPEDGRRALRHLLHCRACQRGLSPYATGLPDERRLAPEPAALPVEPVELSSYDGALDRAIARACRTVPAWNRVEARRRKYLDLAAQQGSPAVLSKEPSWAQVEALLELGFAQRYRDPDAMLRFAVAAQTAADCLDAKPYGAAMVADLRARVEAELANTHRVRDEYERAEAALQRAVQHWEEGTQSPATEARILDVESSLATDRRDLPEALRLLDGAFQVYLELGQHHSAGKILVSRAIVLIYDGRPWEALDQVRLGIAKLDPQRDPQLGTIALQVQLIALTDCGQHQEAASLLGDSDLDRAFAEDALNQAKLLWLQGKICSGLRQGDRAATLLADVEARFRAQGLLYEAGLAGLELAGVLADSGHFTEAEERALEASFALSQLGLRNEALRAVEFFTGACSRRTATALLSQQVVRFLDQLAWRPSLRFVVATAAP